MNCATITQADPPKSSNDKQNSKFLARAQHSNQQHRQAAQAGCGPRLEAIARHRYVEEGRMGQARESGSISGFGLACGRQRRVCEVICDGTWSTAVSEPDADHYRYRALLRDANDEPKRLALIQLLIEEGAREKLAGCG